jgi:glucose-6-phosphate-specific signal transduction histidine kinase
MPHTDIDLLTHLLLALYPAASFFFIEVAARYTNVRPWRKSVLQGIVSLAFAVAYIIIIDAVGLAIALFIFAPLLFIHARNLKNREYLNNSGSREARI